MSHNLWHQKHFRLNLPSAQVVLSLENNDNYNNKNNNNNNSHLYSAVYRSSKVLYDKRRAYN